MPEPHFGAVGGPERLVSYAQSYLSGIVPSMEGRVPTEDELLDRMEANPHFGWARLSDFTNAIATARANIAAQRAVSDQLGASLGTGYILEGGEPPATVGVRIFWRWVDNRNIIRDANTVVNAPSTWTQEQVLAAFQAWLTGPFAASQYGCAQQAGFELVDAPQIVSFFGGGYGSAVELG